MPNGGKGSSLGRGSLSQAWSLGSFAVSGMGLGLEAGFLKPMAVCGDKCHHGCLGVWAPHPHSQAALRVPSPPWAWFPSCGTRFPHSPLVQQSPSVVVPRQPSLWVSPPPSRPALFSRTSLFLFSVFTAP